MRADVRRHLSCSRCSRGSHVDLIKLAAAEPTKNLTERGTACRSAELISQPKNDNRPTAGCRRNVTVICSHYVVHQKISTEIAELW